MANGEDEDEDDGQQNHHSTHWQCDAWASIRRNVAGNANVLVKVVRQL